jgi:peptidyl-prolyl cis-trans isomerase B (cyclophilin B)
VSSERDNRQRAAARARLEREMAARAEAARRKRVLQARIGAGVAAAVVLGAVIWIVVAASGSSSTQGATGTVACTWTDPFPFETASPAVSGSATASPSASASAAPSGSASASASPTSNRVLPPGIQDIGTPPTTVPNTGYQVITFDTNRGPIKMEMNLAKTPCTAASIAYLADKGYYNNSDCHRLVQTIFALQCGDPSGTGSGGVTYTVADENLPKDKLPAYHAGDVAMANTGQPNSNGTQFFFVYDNSQLQGDYSLFGRVVAGMDIIKAVAAGGDDSAFEAQAGGGHPNLKLTLTKVTAGPVTAVPTPTVANSTAPATSTPSPSASASPKAS